MSFELACSTSQSVPACMWQVMDDTAASIQDRLPKPFPLDVCETKFPTLLRGGKKQVNSHELVILPSVAVARYEESMNTVVKQECLRYNKLIWSMTSSLKDFRKAIKGEVSVVPARS